MNYVMDYGLCHGASGIALIYNNFYQNTGLNQFRVAAINWYKVVLQMNLITDNSGYYKSFSVDENDNNIWNLTSGILIGSAGIGLSLISSISHYKPDWQKCLLLI